MSPDPIGPDFKSRGLGTKKEEVGIRWYQIKKVKDFPVPSGEFL